MEWFLCKNFWCSCIFTAIVTAKVFQLAADTWMSVCVCVSACKRYTTFSKLNKREKHIEYFQRPSSHGWVAVKVKESQWASGILIVYAKWNRFWPLQLVIHHGDIILCKRQSWDRERAEPMPNELLSNCTFFTIYIAVMRCYISYMLHLLQHPSSRPIDTHTHTHKFGVHSAMNVAYALVHVAFHCVSSDLNRSTSDQHTTYIDI